MGHMTVLCALPTAIMARRSPQGLGTLANAMVVLGKPRRRFGPAVPASRPHATHEVYRLADLIPPPDLDKPVCPESSGTSRHPVTTVPYVLRNGSSALRVPAYGAAPHAGSSRPS